MDWIGINYDVGTRYGVDAGAPWSCDGYDVDARLDHDLGVIARGLGCDTVQLFGTDVARLGRAASLARAHGLRVWLQPRIVDVDRDEHLAHLADAATVAESVRAVHGEVVVSVGVELSLFLTGFVEGSGAAERMRAVFDPGLDRVGLESSLDDHLAVAEATVRERFGGPVGYGSGMWEPVRWDRRFDLVGLDLYERPIDEGRIIDEIDRHRRHAKPVVVTEYGCVTHRGGAQTFGADVVDWTARPPRLVEGVERDEGAQVDGISRQFAAIRRSSAAGAFCFAFLEPRYSGREGSDLDAASFGVTRAVVTSAPGEPRRIGWRPKAAFVRLAELHRQSQHMS